MSGSPGAAPPRPRASPALTTSLLAIAATAIGLAIHINDGEYHPTRGGAAAIALITLAIIAAGIAVAGWPIPSALRHRADKHAPARRSEVSEGRLPIAAQETLRYAQRDGLRPSADYRTVFHEASPPAASRVFVDATLALLLAVQFAILLFSRPDSAEHSYLQPAGLASVHGYHIHVALAAVISIAVGLKSAKLWLAALVVAFVSLAAWSLARTSVPHSDVHPHIDVFVFQQRGARALLHGRNPYTIDDFPDIYADPATGRARQEVYGPGMSDGHVLHFGFPYLPASLYLATLGYWATGDYRAAQVVALALSAALIYLARPGWTSALAAALLLFTPRVFFVLISGWTEPFLVLCMSACVYCASRQPRLLPIALGLLLATKQYMALAAVPASFLLVPGNGTRVDGMAIFARWRDWLKLMAIAGLVAMVVSAPLALWDLKKFYLSVVTVQKYAPFRWDALSYLTWRAFGHGEPSATTTMILPAVAAAAAIALSLWRAPRTPAGFAASTALTLLVFFAFSKQAFANYYFFVIGALCCAIAASPFPVHQSGAGRAAPTPGQSGAGDINE